mmetsp:Transcript_59950/g.141355  ORF Transcript_59950/g.141355 Transcript_59950/m.141355 type:complete len:356 (-) Transcript_59950:15-1082(-)
MYNDPSVVTTCIRGPSSPGLGFSERLHPGCPRVHLTSAIVRPRDLKNSPASRGSLLHMRLPTPKLPLKPSPHTHMLCPSAAAAAPDSEPRETTPTGTEMFGKGRMPSPVTAKGTPRCESKTMSFAHASHITTLSSPFAAMAEGRTSRQHSSLPKVPTLSTCLPRWLHFPKRYTSPASVTLVTKSKPVEQSMHLPATLCEDCAHSRVGAEENPHRSLIPQNHTSPRLSRAAKVFMSHDTRTNPSVVPIFSLAGKQQSPSASTAPGARKLWSRPALAIPHPYNCPGFVLLRRVDAIVWRETQTQTQTQTQTDTDTETKRAHHSTRADTLRGPAGGKAGAEELGSENRRGRRGGGDRK